MKKEIKQLSLRIDSELLAKFRFVANSNQRSANSQFLMYAKEYVSKFEKQHGKISENELLEFKAKK